MAKIAKTSKIAENGEKLLKKKVKTAKDYCNK